MLRIAVDRADPPADAVRRAAAVIARGGIVAFPTDTLYGLAVDPFSLPAVERLFAVKGRTAGQAVALVAADIEQVEAWLGPLSRAARRLARRFWPGPLTILVDTRLEPLRHGCSRHGRSHDDGSAQARAGCLVPGIAAADGTVGIRVPDHAVARALCRAVGRPLTATSANLSGEPASADPDTVGRALGARIDLLLDAGPTSGGAASTIVAAVGDELRLVRPGAVDWDTIQRCAREG